MHAHSRLCTSYPSSPPSTTTNDDPVPLSPPNHDRCSLRWLDAPPGRWSGFFFIDGSGGTGKTFLYETIISTIRAMGRIVLATASSGVASTLLPRGRTAHSTFCIPINVKKGDSCFVDKESDRAKLLRMADVIVWDEAPMAHRHCHEALERTLRDIWTPTLPWGGKIIIMGGDVRQVRPPMCFIDNYHSTLSKLLIRYTLPDQHHSSRSIFPSPRKPSPSPTDTPRREKGHQSSSRRRLPQEFSTLEQRDNPHSHHQHACFKPGHQQSPPATVLRMADESRRRYRGTSANKRSNTKHHQNSTFPYHLLWTPPRPPLHPPFPIPTPSRPLQRRHLSAKEWHCPSGQRRPHATRPPSTPLQLERRRATYGLQTIVHRVNNHAIHNIHLSLITTVAAAATVRRQPHGHRPWLSLVLYY